MRPGVMAGYPPSMRMSAWYARPECSVSRYEATSAIAACRVESGRFASMNSSLPRRVLSTSTSSSPPTGWPCARTAAWIWSRSSLRSAICLGVGPGSESGIAEHRAGGAACA